tara:strand:- start:53 stop:418 length:366 start_codon:yes stop_codon:yes gene_type:complete
MFKVVCEICQAIHSKSIEVIETGAKSTIFFTDCTVVNRNEEGVSWEENVVVCQYCAYRYDAERTDLHSEHNGCILIDHEDTERIFLEDNKHIHPIAPMHPEEYAAYINGETGRYTDEELAS